MRNYLLLFFLLVFSLHLQRAAAQSVNPKLDSVLQHTLDSMRVLWNCKSLSAAIQLPNDAVWSGASGISSEVPAVDAAPDFVYGIGSVTKTVTAACVLQLADDGALNLDDSLHQWLDTFLFINPNITIRQLLRHESGIYDVVTSPTFQPQMGANPQVIWRLEDVIRVFIRAPLFQPGARWSYSNTNYLLLGLIIEAATGKPYHQVFRERFIDRLGLSSFAMAPFETVSPQIAHLWFDLTGDGVLDDAHQAFFGWDSFDSATGPAGSYYATPADLTKWMRAFASGAFHSAAMMDEVKPPVRPAFRAGPRYGLGLMERKFLSLTAYGHGGDSGYAASSFYFPEKDISISVATNDSRRNSWALASIITALLRSYLDCEALISAAENQSEMVFNPVVFPNPFSDEINIMTENPALKKLEKVILYNATGQQVSVLNQIESVNFWKAEGLKNLPTGFYLLVGWEGGRRIFTSRVVK